MNWATFLMVLIGLPLIAMIGGWIMYGMWRLVEVSWQGAVMLFILLLAIAVGMST